MKFNRALISRYLLATMVSLLLYSFSYPPALQKDFELEKDTQVHLKQKFNDPESNLLRSGSEGLSSVLTLSSDYSFTSFEHFYNSVLQVHFAQIKMDKELFRSSIKIYLHFLKILV